MSRELGILIDPLAEPSGEADVATELAAAAEAHGLDLVVVPTGDRADEAGLDPWTVAVWIAARTDRIAIGVTEPSGAGRRRGAAFGLTDGPLDIARRNGPEVPGSPSIRSWCLH